jgi:hypothetical protein
MDPNLDPQLDLSIPTLLKACKGDPSKLPSFVVHNDEAWPWINKVRPAKGKIHIRRSTFLRVVKGQVPLRAGLWIRPDAQEFFIDLEPHHLQGSERQGGSNADVARLVAGADEAGRLPDEADHGTPIPSKAHSGKVDRGDLERVARDPSRRGVRSAVLSGRDTERPVADRGDE